jgi:hypothetical protein
MEYMILRIMYIMLNHAFALIGSAQGFVVSAVTIDIRVEIVEIYRTLFVNRYLGSPELQPHL